VTVNKIGELDVKVSQVKDTETKKMRTSLTEEAYWELLKKNNPGNFKKCEDLVNKYRDKPGIRIESKESSLVVKFETSNGQQISLFYINIEGRFGVWPMTIKRQLENAEKPVLLFDDYAKATRIAMGIQGNKLEYYKRIEDVDINKFGSGLDRFLEELIKE
jgi:hypothetical protein